MNRAVIVGCCSLLAVPCLASDWSLGGMSSDMVELIDFDTVDDYLGYKEAVIVQVINYPGQEFAIAKELFDCKKRRFHEGRRVLYLSNGEIQDSPESKSWTNIVRNSVKDRTLSEVCHRTEPKSFPEDASISDIIIAVKHTMKTMKK